MHSLYKALPLLSASAAVIQLLYLSLILTSTAAKYTMSRETHGESQKQFSHKSLSSRGKAPWSREIGSFASSWPDCWPNT